MKLVQHEVTIAAPASVVYSHLTEVEGLLRWMAIDAVVDAVPGGELRWTHENGATMMGRFVELTPPSRIVFSYGWEDERMGLPPESTIVEIDLVEREGKTVLTLIHRDLPPESVDAHQHGWVYFLEILGTRLSDPTHSQDH
jgi:uncharacterized protein YndB with AHSA1/START domain